MKIAHSPGRRPACPLLLSCSLLLAALAASASAQVFEANEVETRPALLSAPPLVAPAHQPSFGARIQFQFVVDEQGRPRDATVLEVRATSSETGYLVREADLPVLRRIGLLNGLPADASFAEISELLTKPFVEPARQALLSRRYRAASRNGVNVAARITDVVEYRSDDLPPSLRNQAQQPSSPSARSTTSTAATATASPATTATTTATQPSSQLRSNPEPTTQIEPYRPPTVQPPSPSVLAAAALADRSAGTLTTPGQSPTTVMPTADGRILFSPGQPQTTVVSNPTGSTIYTPGQPPSSVVRVSSTESIIYTPGQPQSTIVNNPGGGSTIYTPGQPPTTVVSTGNGGSIIYAPGQPPVIVQPSP